MFTETLNKTFFVNTEFKRGINKTIKTLKRAYSGYTQLQEAKTLGRHFANFFQPVVADTAHTQKASATIRHEVFCKELNLFDKNEDGIETDFYDSFSTQCLIQHTNSENFAGTVRLILPKSKDDVLPITKLASEHITVEKYRPTNFDPTEVCEISRIAIPEAFRRRNIDKFEGAERGGIDLTTYSEIELRCFPLIAVGLYMASAALAAREGRKHAYFMVEPKLAKSMKYIGIQLEQIGTEFEYVGTRAPYYINYDNFLANLKPSFRFMMNEFTKKIR